MKIETKCCHCDKPIIKYSRNKKVNNWFCSLECKKIFSRNKTFGIFVCDYCGKPFEKKYSEAKRNKHNFCSKECCINSLTDEKYYIEVVCFECGKKFKKYKKYRNRRNNKKDFCSQKCYFKNKKPKDLEKLKLYYYEVGRETGKWEKQILEESQMICYYTNQKLIINEEFIKENLNKHLNSNELQPTIDHKISIIFGFKNKIPTSIIGGKDNLCVCARSVNRTKWISTEKDFLKGNKCTIPLLYNPKV